MIDLWREQTHKVGCHNQIAECSGFLPGFVFNSYKNVYTTNDNIETKIM